MDQKRRNEDDEPSSLPQHILEYQIFPRLPVKSLYRFCSVSKWSRHLTADRGFLDAYRECRRLHYLLSFQGPMHWQPIFYSIEPGSGGEARASPVNVQVTNPRHSITCAKSINGLMCISLNHKIAICQVATNEKRNLPKFPRHDSFGLQKQFIYFCYDPDSDRYKVVRAVSILNNDFQVQDMEYSIFTIGLDESWRKIQASNLYHLKNAKSVCIDGILYCTNFWINPEDEHDGVIARFNVAHEYFHIMSYPDGLSPSRYSSCYVIDLKGSLCVIDTGELVRSCFMTMWFYNSKNYNQGHKSWIEYRIEFPSGWQMMTNLWHNCSLCGNVDGEIVVAVSGLSTVGCCVLIYNVATKKWRKMEVLGLEKRTILANFLIEEYVESPASLSNVFRGKQIKNGGARMN